MNADTYHQQVSLLTRVLPFVAKETDFALKGGTAINLFYRDLPRLSVDIDLIYLPRADRSTALAEIDAAFDRMTSVLSKAFPEGQVGRIAGGGGGDTRLLVNLGGVAVKVETSPVLRGTVHAPDLMAVTEPVESEFGFAEIQVVSFEDLFAGKLVAALDRQHPRDLFDVKLLLENEGVTKALFDTFLVYLSSSSRPPHEILDPNLKDLDKTFVEEFEGMTASSVSVGDLAEARAELVRQVHALLDDRARRFLLAIHDCQPDFDVLGMTGIDELPAIRWKLLNLKKLLTGNPGKHAELRRMIETVGTADHTS